MAANADHGVRPASEAGSFVPVAQWAPFLLGGLTLLALAAGGMLTVLAHNLRASFDGALLVVVLVVSLVGLVVAHRQPSNVIGWLLLGAAGVFALYAVGVLYTVLDYHRHGGTLPLGRVALALEPSWVLGVMMLGLAVALFPNGRIPSGRWRLVLYVYLAAGVWFSVLWSLSQATLRIGRGFDVDGVGNYVGSQTGFAGTTASIAWSAAPLVLVLLIVFLLRQATVWRGATGERRKQLNWLMSGGAVSIVSIVIVTNTNTSGSERAITDIAALGLTALPIAMGVGNPQVPAVRDRPPDQSHDLLRDPHRTARRGVPGHRGAHHARPPVLVPGWGRGLNSCRSRALQPSEVARAAIGRSALQPSPLRRRCDRRGLHLAAAGRRRPRHRAPRAALRRSTGP